MMRVVIILTILLLPLISLGQGNKVKAHQYLLKAEDYYRQKKTAKAIDFYKRAIRESPDFLDAYISLGQFYIAQFRYNDAAEILFSATKTCKKCADALALPLIEQLHHAQQYDQALALIHQWNPPNSLTDQQLKRLDWLKKSVQFGKYAISNAADSPVLNLGIAVNSRFNEYFPSISNDDTTLTFTRATSGMDNDFYRAYRDPCGGWFLPRPLGMPPNSVQQEYAQFVSADNRYLFYQRCDNRSVNGWEMGGCDLFFSYSIPEGWSEAVPFGATINTISFEGMPSLSSDNTVLYFVSDRDGGYGGKDIWKSRFENGLWQIPENLGPEVNTSGDETAPFIAPDNHTLYFTSNGHPGLGGNDIFKAVLSNSGYWTKVENLGIPVNSPYEEVSFAVAPTGQKAYFSSNRPGGMGGMDLYEVALASLQQPVPVTYVYGKVLDSLTNEIIPYTQIEWWDSEANNITHHYQSNRGDASYLAVVALDKPYYVTTYRSGYKNRVDTLIYHTSNTALPDTFNIKLLPNYYREPVKYKAPPYIDSLVLTHNFLKNEFKITDHVQQHLKEIIEPLLIRNFEIFVNGYTDAIGAQHINEAISFERANEVAAYLLTIGVAKAQINVQGWADAYPVAPSDSEDNCYKNRRVEVIIRYFNEEF